MKFKIQKDDILLPLQHISRIATSKVIPILNGVLIKVDSNRMILVGGDSNNILRYELNNDRFTFAESGSIVLPIAKLYEIIKKMDEEWIQMSLIENHIVHIVSGNSNIRLVGMDAVEYPNVNMEKSEQQVAIPGDVLIDLISQTIYAISSREDTPLLTGVHIQVSQDAVCFTTCDRHRAARMIKGIASGLSEDIIINGKTLVEIKNIVKNESPVIMDFLEHRVIFKQGSFTFAVTPMEGRYPNIEKMIGMESSTKVVVSTKQLLRSLERSLIISDSNTGFITTMQINNDHLKIFCQSENGFMDEHIKLESLEGDGYEINYNVKFALVALKTIRTEYTAIYYGVKQRLIVFKPHEQENVLHLIMGALK